MGKHIVSSPPKILFRADAKPRIGIGDLMSLIHLSKYFQATGWATAFMIRSYPAALKLARKYELKNVSIIDPNISIPDEVLRINEFVAENEVDLVFFEITENKLSDYTSITPDVYKACVSFDGHIPSDMDLVVDWDVAAHQYFTPSQYPGSKFLLGAEYVILPFNFDKKRIRARRLNTPPKKLLICMGGADEFNLTCDIADALTAKRINMDTTIIVGSGYEHRNELEACLRQAAFPYEIKENICDMFEEYMACDIAIGAGGLTASELVATGTPAFLVAAYQHQKARCEYFDKKGWATYLGTRDEFKNNFSGITNPGINKNSSAFFNTEKIVTACNEIVF